MVVLVLTVPEINGDRSRYHFEWQDDQPLHGITVGEALVKRSSSIILSTCQEIVWTYFQPIANPHAGSKNLVEKAEKEPVTGKSTAISPSACTVQYIMIPMRLKQINRLAGPPAASDLPEATKRPVPIRKIMLENNRQPLRQLHDPPTHLSSHRWQSSVDVFLSTSLQVMSGPWHAQHLGDSARGHQPFLASPLWSGRA